MTDLHPLFAGIVQAWQSAPSSRQLPQDAGQRVVEKQRLSPGTRLAKYRGMNQRCKLTEYHGNNRGTFECPKGHQFRQQLLKKTPNGRPPSEQAIRMMAHWWRGGVYMPCPKCEK